ncbi:MAG: hypothetical protein C4527_20960 [Candidatus Omnitrophota bacterium]|nr:MAG: hypothetical protein C4527_20960 [Candidatus Omnitrophota bacterium]
MEGILDRRRVFIFSYNPSPWKASGSVDSTMNSSADRFPIVGYRVYYIVQSSFSDPIDSAGATGK